MFQGWISKVTFAHRSCLVKTPLNHMREILNVIYVGKVF